MALDKAWKWNITEGGKENVTQNNYLLYIISTARYNAFLYLAVICYIWLLYTGIEKNKARIVTIVF
ncbi:hypothetical protein D7V96_23890 [bacterium D16-59]|nr:hypothetical protein D7V96_23890 [bacterium D16-59]